MKVTINSNGLSFADTFQLMVNESNSFYRTNYNYYDGDWNLGLNVFSNGDFGWLRSSGTYVTVMNDKVVFEGTRHSVAELIGYFFDKSWCRQAKVIEVKSLSSAPWWQCGVKADGLDKARRIKSSYAGTRLFGAYKKAGIPEALWGIA